MDVAAPQRVGVMFVIYGLAPAGPERRLLDLARAFASRPERLDVHVCVVGDDLTLLDEFTRTGARLLHVPIRRPWLEWARVRTVLAYVRRHDIRVLNSFNLKTLIVAAAARVRFGPRVTLVHHLISLWDDLSPAQQRMTWAALRCADAVLCNGHAVREHVIGARRLSQPVSVIPNGVDADYFHPMPALGTSERRRLGFGDEHVVVGTIGNIRPVKNVPLLLRAVSRVAAVHPSVRLLVVGGGPQLEEARALALSLGLADKAVFTGLVKDVRPLLAAMDLFALASRQEGNPNVVLQSMAMALPVVSVRVGEVPHVVEHGRSGLLVAPGDEDALAAEIGALVCDAMRRRALGDAARCRVRERFTASQMIADYASLMRSVSARASRR